MNKYYGIHWALILWTFVGRQINNYYHIYILLTQQQSDKQQQQKKNDWIY